MVKTIIILAIAAAFVAGMLVSADEAFSTHKTGHEPGGGGGGDKAATDVNCTTPCIDEVELNFDTANQAELSAHAAMAAAHHNRYTDAEAVIAVGPHTASPTQADIEGLGFVTGAHTVDTDTQLTEAQVDAFVANNGFLSGLITLLDLAFDPATQTELDTHAGSPSVHHVQTVDTTLTEAQVDAFADNNGYANVAGDTFTGGIIAPSFSGDGSALTSIAPANIDLGTAGIDISGNAATATTANSLSGTLAIANGGTGLTTAPTTAGQFLRSTGAGVWGIGVLQASDIPALTLAGDVTGSLSANTVTALQGSAVSALAPSPNDVLTWDGSSWVPSPTAAGATGWTDDGTVVRLTTGTDLVGIGTASPISQLHIKGDNPQLTLEATGVVNPQIDFRDSSGVLQAEIAYSQSLDKLQFSNLGPPNHFLVFDTDGDLGIGTSTPSAKLDVVGNVQTSGDYSYSSPQSRKLVMAGGEFNPNSSDGIIASNSVRAVAGGVSGVFHAPIHTIPDGAKITKLECVVTDSSGTYDLDCAIVFVTSTGSAGLLLTLSTSLSPGLTTLNSGTTNIDVDRDTKAYLMSFKPTDKACGSLCKLHAVIITYDVSQAS